MAKLEDLKFRGDLPFRPKPRNRIEEALMPALKKLEEPQPAPVPAPEPEKEKPKYLRKVIIGALSLILLSAFVSGIYLIYKKYRETKISAPDTTLEEVGKLIDLPKDEEPTIATVSDLTPLKTEPFFKDAKVGDKVLIYSAAKKAILYRPSTEKIIIVAPIR